MHSFELSGEKTSPKLEGRDGSHDSSFESLLRTAISEGMEGVLGPGGARAIFYHLGLPDFQDPKKFHDKLATIFGVGTASLEHVIIRRLYELMGVHPSGGDEDFLKDVERAKRHYTADLNRKH